MEFIGELEIYDSICEPVMVVDEKNKVKWFNTSALELCKVNSFELIEDLGLEEILSFYDLKNNSFQPKEIKKTDSIIKVQALIKINNIKKEIILVVKETIINNKKYTLLLINKIADTAFIEEKKVFYSKDFNGGYCEDDNKTQVASVIFDETPTGVIIEKDKKITYINNSAKKFFGYKHYLGTSFYDSIGVNFIKENIYKDNLIENTNNANIVKVKFIKEDETEMFCEICLIPFRLKGILYNIYLIKDITDEAIAEKVIKNSHDNYLRLFNSLPFGVAVYEDNKIILSNEIHNNIFGYKSKEELHKKKIWEVVQPNYEGCVRNMYYNSYTNDDFCEFEEIQTINSKGKCIDVEIAITGKNIDNNKWMVIVSKKIDEKKKAEINKIKLEEAIKYDKLKNKFISNMSHELLTPLNIILSTVQLTERSYKNGENVNLKKCVELTKGSSYRLLRSINNLIDITKIDIGNLKMNFENCDIVKIVEDITLAAVEEVENKGMTLVFDTDIEEKIIGIDKANIERIMLNLLSNAVKFSKDNGAIKVELHDLGEWLQIKVKDNGIGIPEEKIDLIFDKFVQSEDLFTRSHEGSGIGLSLVRSIVERHGGIVYVNSIVNTGSEFVVELPNIEADNMKNKDNIYCALKENKDRVKIEFSDIYK